MKHCVRFLLLLVLILLLHEGAMGDGAASRPVSTDRPAVETCTLTQAPTAQELLDDIYNHIFSQSVCLDVVDTAQVPANKVLRLLASYVQALHFSYETQDNHHTYHSVAQPRDPSGYYVFGLRKILI